VYCIPLQSLRSELHELPDIPFVVDGNTEDDLALITEFANSISTRYSKPATSSG
jgi:hypothetical protein